MNHVRLVSIALAAAAVWSCSDDVSDRALGAGAPRSDAGQRDGGTQDALAAPDEGVQVETRGREIPAGADQEWCEVVQLPGRSDQQLFVGRTELWMTPYSHHLIVSMAQGSDDPLDEAALHEPARCTGAHDYGTNLVTLAASALPYSSQTLPEGIGYTLRGGQRLLFDYHAFNTSERPIRVQHALNLHYVPRIERPARVFGFYNQYIDIPAHSRRSFGEQCTVKDDLLVWSVSRHTHRFGTDFRVLWAGGDRDGELLWTSHDWERDINHRLEQPTVVPAGTGFRWECDFDNPTDSPLIFGPAATDEMCILFGAFAAVGDDAEVGPQSCYRFQPSP